MVATIAAATDERAIGGARIACLAILGAVVTLLGPRTNAISALDRFADTAFWRRGLTGGGS